AVAQAGTIEIGGLPGEAGAIRLEGQPRRLVRPHGVLVDAALGAELERALAELTITQLPPAASAAGAAGITIDLGTVRGTITPDCGDPALALLVASTGAGCVPRAAADAVLA